MKQILGPFLGFLSNKPSYWLILLTEDNKVIHRYKVHFDRHHDEINWILDERADKQPIHYLFNWTSEQSQELFALKLSESQLLFKIKKIPGEEKVNRVERYTFNGREMTWHTDSHHIALSSQNTQKRYPLDITPIIVNLSNFPNILNARFAERIKKIQMSWKAPAHLLEWSSTSPSANITRANSLSLSDAISSLCEPQCLIQSSEPTIVQTKKPTIYFWYDNSNWWMKANIGKKSAAEKLGTMLSDKPLVNLLQSVKINKIELDITETLQNTSSSQATNADMPSLMGTRVMQMNLMEYICARYLGLSLNQRKTIEALLEIADIWPLQDQFSEDAQASYLSSIFSQSDCDLVEEVKECFDAYSEFVKPTNLKRLEQHNRFYTAPESSVYREIENQATVSVVYDFIHLLFVTAAVHIDRSELIRSYRLPLEYAQLKIGHEISHETAGLTERELLLSDIFLNEELLWWTVDDDVLIEAQTTLEAFIDQDLTNYPHLHEYLSAVWDDAFYQECRAINNELTLILKYYQILDTYEQENSIDSLTILASQIDSSQDLLVALHRLPYSLHQSLLQEIINIKGDNISNIYTKFINDCYFSHLSSDKQKALVKHEFFLKLIAKYLDSWEKLKIIIDELSDEAQLLLLANVRSVLLKIPDSLESFELIYKTFSIPVKIKIACLLPFVTDQLFCNIFLQNEVAPSLMQLINLNQQGFGELFTKISRLSNSLQKILIEESAIVEIIATNADNLILILKHFSTNLHGILLNQIDRESLLQIANHHEKFFKLLNTINANERIVFLNLLGSERMTQVIQSMDCVEMLLQQFEESFHQKIIELVLREPIKSKILPNINDEPLKLTSRIHLWKSLRPFNVELPNYSQHHFQLSPQLYAHYQSAKDVAHRLQESLLSHESSDWIWNKNDEYLNKTLLSHPKLASIYGQVCDFFRTLSHHRIHEGAYSSPGVVKPDWF